MNAMFSPDQFPSRSGLQRGVWAPVLFTPNPDTAERFVIAVAAVNETGFHVARADAAKKLACLYGSAAASALMVQEATLNGLEEDLATRGRAALANPALLFSGVSIGELRDGEAVSMDALASSWLVATSSLHTGKSKSALEIDDAVEAAVASIDAQTDNDRLPVLVYKAVEEAEPELGNYFSADIRSRAKRTARPAPQKVFIGFAGSRVVANFATLKPTRPRGMIDHIKRLMWDLAQHQDDEAAMITGARLHEMIVFHRDENDPEFEPSKVAVLKEMLDDLREQGAKDGIGVQPRSSVPAIAAHVQRAERLEAV